MKLSRDELQRYSRHLSLKEFGIESQLRLKAASVLIIGAGGLGCPALLYLTAAGVGRIGVMDFDKVEIHNLQRQVLYNEDDIGRRKADAAIQHLRKRNSLVEFECFDQKLTPESALEIFPAFHLIIDCTDNFSARYAINDACVMLDKPFVYGSIFKFEGQVSLFNVKDKNGNNGPTYRCLFPEPPEEGTIPSCEEAGVIGFLPGLIGTLQTAEAIKLITGTGETLSGKLLSLNSFTMQFDLFDVERKENLWAKLLSKESITR
jgi:molybdopterin/thiamine biosynthesis adenylyltransferase